MTPTGSHHLDMQTANTTPAMNTAPPVHRRPGCLPPLALAILTVITGMLSATAHESEAPDRRAPELPSPSCDTLDVPAGHRVSARLYASGVQIYQWDGDAWAFVAPEAGLFADPHHRGSVGIHYGGPTWEARDGSQVIAVPEARCTPFPDAIPWLRLRAVATSDHGRFARVTYILRVNTLGGLAPAEAGTYVGEEARVPYTAEYYLYRASHE